MPRKQPTRLTHLDRRGQARMVDVTTKSVTRREAAASARVQMTEAALDAVFGGRTEKGDALATARIAGIAAAKRTAEWIPLCHPLPLTWTGIDFQRAAPTELLILCTVRISARTGVEMEAMTGAAAAALTVYDMVKSVDKAASIGPIRLERKSGGKSGSFRRPSK